MIASTVPRGFSELAKVSKPREEGLDAEFFPCVLGKDIKYQPNHRKTRLQRGNWMCECVNNY